MLPKLDWRRILVEGAVIVFSILLAFAIDAAWDGAQDRRRAERLIGALRADVEHTRIHIGELRERRQILIDGARGVLQSLARGDALEVRDSVLATVGTVFTLSGWTPNTSTYEQALGSGDLALLQDTAIRRQLGAYHASLRRVADISESINRQYYGELEPFLVENTIYSEMASAFWREFLVADAPFRMDYDALAANPALWNLITLKLELEVAMADALDRADARSLELMEVLKP